MRVLAVGAGGVGTSAALIAARRGFFETWVVSDYDIARAEAVVDRIQDDRFVAAQVDASSVDAVADLCRAHGITHVLNVVDPRFVMPIFDGAFAAGADYLDTAMSLSRPNPRAPVRGGRRQARRRAVREGAVLGRQRTPGPVRHRRRAWPGRRVRPLRGGPPLQRDRRGRDPRRREPGRGGLRLRALVLDLDDDRGVPQPAGHLGEGPGLVHDRAVLRGGGLRLP